MVTENWRDKTDQELSMAAAARRAGNEGRARVCARRAAGHVIGEYFARNQVEFTSESALERIRYMYSSPNIEPGLHELIGHFLVHTSQV